MKRHLSFIAVCLGAAVVAGCRPFPIAGGPSATTDRLTLTGSSTIAPMISEIARQFEKDHPGVRVDVQTGGSSRGIRDAKNGVADIGMSSRALKPAELTGLKTKTIGWDGVAFVVHADNPVGELTREQLIDIYTGRVDNWLALGGNDAPIVVSNRAAGRSELELIVKFLGLKPTDIKADVIDGETQQSIKTVTTNVNAIVYTSVGAAHHAAQQGEPIKLLPLGGVFPTIETVRSGEFPLARPLVLIQPAESSNNLARAFVRYAASSKVDNVTRSLGYVPPNRDD